MVHDILNQSPFQAAYYGRSAEGRLRARWSLGCSTRLLSRAEPNFYSRRMPKMSAVVLNYQDALIISSVENPICFQFSEAARLDFVHHAILGESIAEAPVRLLHFDLGPHNEGRQNNNRGERDPMMALESRR